MRSSSLGRLWPQSAPFGARNRPARAGSIWARMRAQGAEYCNCFARISNSKLKLEKRGGKHARRFGAAGRPPRGPRGPRGRGGSLRDRACPGRPSSSTSWTDLRRSRSVDHRTPRRRPRWSGRRRARRLSARAHARGRGRSRRALPGVAAHRLRVLALGAHTERVARSSSGACCSPLEAPGPGPSCRPRAARPARTARTRMRYGRAEGATCGSGRWLCIVAY